MNILYNTQKPVDYAYTDKLIEEKIKDIQVDRILRIIFAILIYAGVCTYVYHVMNIIYKQGELNQFLLSTSIVITLLGTTTANIVALLIIVSKYLFPQK